jgi:protein-tyrosine phosphatase
MIDLHCHILPGVDDGARTLEEALKMAELAVADGCRVVVATPHQRRDEWSLPEASVLEQLLGAMKRAVPQLELQLGAEVRVDSDLVRELLGPKRGGILTLAGSSYLLLEFDPEGFGPEPVFLVEELRSLGFRPIVAHPEVTLPLFMEEGLLARMVEAGARLQVTAASLVGRYGPEAERAAWSLIEEGLVHFVASDAHRPDWRPPGLREALRRLELRLGRQAAEALTIDHPARVIQDLPLAHLPARNLAPAAKRRQ